MATTVLLEVTAAPSAVPPPELLSVIAAAGQPTAFGMSRRGSRPWRYRFQLTGPDRVAAGKVLETRLRDLGYDADVSVWP